MRFFNKLERRFGRYAIHNLMYYIIIMYVMGFVMMYMDPMFFTRYLSLDAEAILHGQVWRLVTFLLYPPTLSPFWIIFAALMYYSLGRSLEAVPSANPTGTPTKPLGISNATNFYPSMLIPIRRTSITS